MLKIVKVNSNYIEYLRGVDKLVYDNKNGSRPYIGYLIDVDGSLFVAPLTSPKPKHKTWKKGKKDTYLIDGGEKGVLQLSNMIPVEKSLCEELDLSMEDSYTELLRSQFIDIDNNKYEIEIKARKLIELNEAKPNHYILKTCCDYKVLKQASKNWLVNTKL